MFSFLKTLAYFYPKTTSIFTQNKAKCIVWTAKLLLSKLLNLLQIRGLTGYQNLRTNDWLPRGT